MKREISALRVLAAALVALGFSIGGAALTATSAQAQDASQETAQETPWYMPQPWMYPPQTGPVVHRLRGQYGYNREERSNAYGSFGQGCYGYCRQVPGTITTGSYVVLSRPVVAIFDPNRYDIVERQAYSAPQPSYETAPAAPAQPMVVPVRNGVKPATLPKPRFTMQNGVRVIRLTPLADK
ncbi:MAG: hypothetical protein R3D05_14900 [Dongiaceae bacterium]